MIKPMAMGNIYIIMELNILDIGRMINSMVKAKKRGQVQFYLYYDQMELITRANMRKEKSMEKESQFLQMDLIMTVTLITMIFMEEVNQVFYELQVYMSGLIKENMKANGKEIKCMGKELQFGQIIVVIMESRINMNIDKYKLQI